MEQVFDTFKHLATFFDCTAIISNLECNVNKKLKKL